MRVIFSIYHIIPVRGGVTVQQGQYSSMLHVIHTIKSGIYSMAASVGSVWHMADAVCLFFLSRQVWHHGMISMLLFCSWLWYYIFGSSITKQATIMFYLSNCLRNRRVGGREDQWTANIYTWFRNNLHSCWVYLRVTRKHKAKMESTVCPFPCLCVCGLRLRKTEMYATRLSIMYWHL